MLPLSITVSMLGYHAHKCVQSSIDPAIFFCNWTSFHNTKKKIKNADAYIRSEVTRRDQKPKTFLGRNGLCYTYMFPK